MFHRLTAFLDTFLEMGIPGFDCLIKHKGETVYRHFNGFSSLETQTPMNGQERYNIYSCSKPITCTAALQLYEQGLFRLDDRLSDYMPEFAHMTVKTENGLVPAQNPITIRHLFTMTAGFSYNVVSDPLLQARKDTNGRCQTREVMPYLAQEPLSFEPGTRWQYSLCHDVLAALVEVISGCRFEEYVKKHIFDPLGMTRSTFLLPENELDTLCEQYRFNSETKTPENCGKTTQTYKLGTQYASGGAGCISTVEDYMRFLEAMRVGNVILRNETIDQMQVDLLTDATRKDYWYTQYGYGLGVRTPIPAAGTTDFGWGGAAGAFLSIDRVHDITIYYAQHLLTSPNGNHRRTLPTVAINYLYGKQIELVVPGDAKLTALLANYL